VISVVVPTIKGREDLCQKTIASFRATVPADELQIIIVKDRKAIGTAWNDGAEAAQGEYLMLAADDVIVHPGWAEAAIEAADRSLYPAPRLQKIDGSVLATGSMGGGWLLTDCADWAPVVSSQFPFFSHYVWQEMGPCLDIHYFADDYLAARARSLGMNVVYREPYRITHLEGVAGRDEMVRRSMTDRLQFEQSLANPDYWIGVAV
jgi:GT2 family glycosyltransferase